MPTMNISLSEKFKAYVDSRVASGDFESASEFIRHLIRQDREERRAELLERIVREAEESGPPISAEEASKKMKSFIEGLQQPQ